MNICIYTVHLFLYECIACKLKSCLSNYCTFHISYVTTNTQKCKKTSMKSWWTTCRSCWSGQRFSSTSHLMFSIAMHRGKNLLECRTALQWSAAMSSHAAFMASSRHLILWSMIIYFPPPCWKNGSDCAVGNPHIYAPKLDWLNGWFKL